MSSDTRPKHDFASSLYTVDEPGGCGRSPAGFVSPVRASEVMPATPPRLMLSTALLGTMIVVPPRSLTLSYSMFMPRKCRAIGSLP